MRERDVFVLYSRKTLFSEEWENDFAYTACLLSATTGMRMGEVRALTKEQIRDGYILVDASWNDSEGRKSTKSGAVREVPICDEVRDRMDEVGIDYAKDNLTFNSFRHFFNTRLVAGGVDGEIIRSAIGHEDEEMTEHYLHLKASDMHAVNKFQIGLMNSLRKKA